MKGLVACEYYLIGIEGGEKELKMASSLMAGYATKGQGAGPLIVTERAGLFEKYGLHVQTRLMGGARGVVRGLMSGEIQFGNLAAPNMMRLSLEENLDLVYLTGGINQQFLVGRPGIARVEQLTGRTIGVPGEGGLSDVMADFVIDRLKLQGIRPVQMSAKEGVRLTGLINGEYDATILTPPDAMEARKRGCRFLVDFTDYGMNFALGGIASRRSYISKNMEITKSFIKAYAEGMHRYRTDRNFTVKVQAEYSTLSDPSIAEETYDITAAGMPKVPFPKLEALRAALKVMAKEFPLAAKADPRQFVDDSVLKELDADGFIAGLYR